MAGGQHQEPLVRDRRARRHPEAWSRRRALRAGIRFGGHALYVKDNRLHYVNNFVGAEEQMVVGSEDVPTGENLILSASFEKDGQRADLRERDAVALPRRHEGRRGRDQDPARRLCDRRRAALRRPSRPASRSPTTIPGEPPYTFTGGDIQQVAVDVSGEPYVDMRASGGDGAAQPMTSDLLVSWNDTPTRAAIVDFVERVTTGGRAGLRPTRRAGRRLRQRRDAVVREADADRARLHPRAPRRDGRGGRVAARQAAVEGGSGAGLPLARRRDHQALPRRRQRREGADGRHRRRRSRA